MLAHSKLLPVTSTPSSPSTHTPKAGGDWPQFTRQGQETALTLHWALHTNLGIKPGVLQEGEFLLSWYMRKVRWGLHCLGLWGILLSTVKHPKDSGISRHYKSRGHHMCDWIIYSSAFTLHTTPEHHTKRKIMKYPPLQSSLSNLKRHFQEPFSLNQRV